MDKHTEHILKLVTNVNLTNAELGRQIRRYYWANQDKIDNLRKPIDNSEMVNPKIKG